MKNKYSCCLVYRTFIFLLKFLYLICSSRKESLARAIEHESSGNTAGAYECYQKAVDISPAIAYELIQVQFSLVNLGVILGWRNLYISLAFIECFLCFIWKLGWKLTLIFGLQGFKAGRCLLYSGSLWSRCTNDVFGDHQAGRRSNHWGLWPHCIWLSKSK